MASGGAEDQVSATAAHGQGGSDGSAMTGRGAGRLQRLLRPRTLAFVGGDPALTSLRQCEELGFNGDLWYVHPERGRGDGRAGFRHVGDLPGPPDAALVAVNRAATVGVVRSLSEIGAGAAVCYASGFAEVGGAGLGLSDELLVAADGMPIIGPNCYGVASGLTGAALWPDEQGLHRVDNGVAFVTQSGNIAVNLTMQQRGLDVALVMALGNQIDVGVEECLEALVVDPAITAVAMYVEALTDVGRFAAAADEARSRRKPLVVLKSGSSSKGAGITASHTSSLAGDDDAYTALFDRVGVRRVHSVPELLDTLSVMSRMGPLSGNRTVSLSCSGGEASLVADRAGDFELDFADFDDDHRARIAATLNEFVSVSNPLDYHTFIWGDRERLQACFAAVLDGPFDAAMLIVDFPRPGVDPASWWATLEAVCAAAEACSTPVVVASTMAECLPAEAIERAGRSGLAAVGSIGGALQGIAACAWWGRPRSGLVAPLPSLQVDAGNGDPAGSGGAAGFSATADSVGSSDSEVSEGSGLSTVPGASGRPGASARSGGTADQDMGAGSAGWRDAGAVMLDEPASKALLAGAGVAVPQHRTVSATDAADAAEELGFPVVLKTVGPAHKSDSGGVVLGLKSRSEVAAAARRLAAGVDKVLVEAMVADAAAEILVSVRRCEPVGWLLTVGAGGTLVELIRDTRSALLPVSSAEIEALLDGLACRPLLGAHRGRPAGDVAALIELIAAVAALVEADPGIVEIEINPVIVSTGAAVAADALITRRQN